MRVCLESTLSRPFCCRTTPVNPVNSRFSPRGARTPVAATVRCRQRRLEHRPRSRCRRSSAETALSSGCDLPLAGLTGWWFGTWIIFFHILGMSSSQLTFIFFRGVGLNHQTGMTIYPSYIGLLWILIALIIQEREIPTNQYNGMIEDGAPKIAFSCLISVADFYGLDITIVHGGYNGS